jgi:hypothetical protein
MVHGMRPSGRLAAVRNLGLQAGRRYAACWCGRVAVRLTAAPTAQGRTRWLGAGRCARAPLGCGRDCSCSWRVTQGGRPGAAAASLPSAAGAAGSCRGWIPRSASRCLGLGRGAPVRASPRASQLPCGCSLAAAGRARPALASAASPSPACVRGKGGAPRHQARTFAGGGWCCCAQPPVSIGSAPHHSSTPLRSACPGAPEGQQWIPPLRHPRPPHLQLKVPQIYRRHRPVVRVRKPVAGACGS